MPLSQIDTPAGRPTVAVIGAGFSGVLTAIHLLRASDGPRVLLLERGPRFGRGAAYATANPRHLLNVRGANMSAFADAPNHFLDWLGARAEEGERVFVTRDRYGDYLQSLLRDVQASAAGRLSLEHDEAVAVAKTAGGWSVRLAMGRSVAADAVVLALGNPPPPTPAGVSEAVLASDRWIADPWTWIERPGAVRGDVLLIGSGLTAADVAIAVEGRDPSARILALSRHGLMPRAHAPAPAIPAPMVLEAEGRSARRILRRIREAGGEWRGAVDALRPHVQDLWRSWSPGERRRFLRHARPWWEVVRHRLAPQVASHLGGLGDAGRLEIAAGRLDRIDLAQAGLEAAWSPRGGGAPRRRSFALAINCAGPLSDIARSDDPLLAGLVAAGLARPDACGLGLDVDHRSRLAGASGISESLFAVGPLARGQVYEMTSVPDIRLQASEVAGAILAHLDGRRARGADAGEDARLATALRRHIEERSAELEVEFASRAAARRMRGAWELRGRLLALKELGEWLEGAGGSR